MVKGLINVAEEAGKKILSVYYQPQLFEQVEHKQDNSPLTLADKLSNAVITDYLSKQHPDTLIISEEGKDIPYEERKQCHRFWLIDPLDGTKEFIKRNGEFTVNIALVENGSPVLGVIHIPVQGITYFTENGQSFKKLPSGNIEAIRVSGKKNGLTAIGSSSHASEEEADFLKNFNITNTTKAGSSLKFCYVADGRADIYYRSGSTMEWDTAAGHAIVLQAGGRVEGLTYNKPHLKNSAFCVYGFAMINKVF